MTAGQALAFNAATDKLDFTHYVGLTASQVSVNFVPFTVSDPDRIVLVAPARTLTFNDAGGYRAPANGVNSAIFGDGSILYAGQTGNDSVTGTAGADGLYGGLGNDTFDGGEGNDQLQGNQGN